MDGWMDGSGEERAVSPQQEVQEQVRVSEEEAPLLSSSSQGSCDQVLVQPGVM